MQSGFLSHDYFKSWAYQFPETETRYYLFIFNCKGPIFLQERDRFTFFIALIPV